MITTMCFCAFCSFLQYHSPYNSSFGNDPASKVRRRFTAFALVDCIPKFIAQILRTMQPNLMAYESGGGKVLDSVIDNLATAGKCVQIGFISSYLEKGGMARGVSPQGKRTFVRGIRTRPPRRASSNLTRQNYRIIPAKQYPQEID